MEDILIDIIDFIDEKDPNNVPISEDLYDIVRTLYNSICCKQINLQNIVSHIVYMMKLANEFIDIENKDKKQSVLFVLNKFIDMDIYDAEEKKIMHTFVNDMVPGLIDTLCAVDNSEVIINLKNETLTFCAAFKKKLCCCSA